MDAGVAGAHGGSHVAAACIRLGLTWDACAGASGSTGSASDFGDAAGRIIGTSESCVAVGYGASTDANTRTFSRAGDACTATG